MICIRNELEAHAHLDADVVYNLIWSAKSVPLNFRGSCLSSSMKKQIRLPRDDIF